MASPAASKPFHIVLPTSHLTHGIIALHSRGSQNPEYASDLFEQKTSFGQTHQTGNGSSPPLKSTTRQWSERKWMNGSMYIPFQIQIKGRNDKRRVREIRSFAYSKLSASNVDPSLVIVLCLNQGNATGLLTLLVSHLKIGALIGLNVWMPFKAQIGKIPEMVPRSIWQDCARFFGTIFGVSTLAPTKKEQSFSSPGLAQSMQSFQHIPGFLSHNADDESICIDLNQESRAVLQEAGMIVVRKEHKDGEHFADLKTRVLKDTVEFLAREIRDRP